MSRIVDYGKKRIEKAVLGGRLSHAVLITGDDHICRDIVRYAASLLFSKTEATVDDFPDFLHIDGKSLRVASAEELLNEMNVTPNSGKRLISLENAGNMSVVVQNMLLKTIEEPPLGNHFFLYGNESGLLPTIKSRCATLSLGLISYDDVAEYVKLCGASESDALYYARLGGSVDTAVKMYTDAEYRSECLKSIEYICTIGQKSLVSDKLRNIASGDAVRAVDMFDMALSDMRRIKLGMEQVFFTRSPLCDDIKKCAERLTEKQIDEIFTILRQVHSDINKNAPAKQVFDNFAAKTEQVIYNGK